MHIRTNIDDGLAASLTRQDKVDKVKLLLGRYTQLIHQVEITLSYKNGSGSLVQKRCDILIEMSQRQSIEVSDTALTAEEALHNALLRAKRLIIRRAKQNVGHFNLSL